MLAIQSYITTDRSDIAKTIIFAEYSHSLLKKHGYTTQLCIEESLYSRFKHIPYDDFVFFPSYYLKLATGHTRFGTSSVFAVSNVNEPFIHIDFDMFMLKDIVKPFKNSSAFFIHTEPWLTNEFYDLLSFITQHVPEFKKITTNLISCNGSIFGGSDYKTYNVACQQLLTTVYKYNKFLEKYKHSGTIIGQVFLNYYVVKLLYPNSDRKTVDTIFKVETPEDLFEHFKSNNFVHFWSPVKQKLIDSSFLMNKELEVLLKPFCI
jgi:hypothetical protein